MNIQDKITQEGKIILKRLSFLPDLHIVGGYVRDAMMGVNPSDIDLATSADPYTVSVLCINNGLHVVPTGMKHGTVTVFIDDEGYEVTTFRSDHNCDGRHAEVEYVSTIEEDLARRDFTMNAMGINAEYDLIDPYGGLKDMTKLILKCVGDPLIRFAEDKLRIIRACRFAAQYGLIYDRATYNSMELLADHIFQSISVERFVMEVNKAFKMYEPSNFLRELYNLKILQNFIPDFYEIHSLLQNPEYHPEGNVWVHTMQVVDNTVGVEGRWIALLHDIGKSKTAEPVPDTNYYSFHGHEEKGAEMILKIGKRLKLSNDLIHKIEMGARYHMRAYHIMPFMKKNKVRRFQHDVTAKYLPLLKALCIADSEGRKDINLAVFDPMPEEIVLKPAVTGDMIMERLKCNEGPIVGSFKQACMNYQLETGETDPELIWAAVVCSESIKLTFEAWYNQNEDEINITLAETGADRELDFDLEREIEVRYERYLNGV